MAARPPKSRAPLYVGLAAAGGVGYYLYSAGGNPKVAEKQFEHDAARASAAVKSELPGRGKQVKKEGEVYGEKVDAFFDKAADDAQGKLSAAEARAKQLGNDVRKDLQGSIDRADRRVEESAAKVKEGVNNGWNIFSGKK
ncbi:MAG: hypothetical protein M1824_004295 [Vezdaea acicularis]|nr:MAG: hypothetical protein M1824_004295 [Vezdaea acicularis]